ADNVTLKDGQVAKNGTYEDLRSQNEGLLSSVIDEVEAASQRSTMSSAEAHGDVNDRNNMITAKNNAAEVDEREAPQVLKTAIDKIIEREAMAEGTWQPAQLPSSWPSSLAYCVLKRPLKGAHLSLVLYHV
ncbi:hypothetical protein HKX48_006712, partial [Thoreauomyces humboldtii]